MYEPDSFRPLALVEGNAAELQKTRTYWYQNDHLGTPHSLTDSLGNLVYSCSYNAYGQVLTETHHQQEEKGLRVETNLRFQGQYWDEETGLHYNFNRYYDPGLGRYLTQDPIKLLGGLNQYRYCNNPINWIDPFGLINTNSSGTESIFYSVQSENDVNRLMSGGNPWPNKPTEAHLGEGVYTWGSQAEAESYLARLNNKEWAKDANLQVIEVKVNQIQYDSLKTFDMRNVSDDITNEWLGKHSSLYGKGELHDFEHVIRPAGIGDEFYFSKSILSLLKFEVK